MTGQQPDLSPLIYLVEACVGIIVLAFIIKHAVLAALRTHSKEQERKGRRP